jgi:hypothetical protein
VGVWIRQVKTRIQRTQRFPTEVGRLARYGALVNADLAVVSSSRIPLATSGACPRRAMIDGLIATAGKPNAPTGLVPVERVTHGATERRNRVPTGVKPVEDNGNCGRLFSQSIDLPLAQGQWSSCEAPELGSTSYCQPR